MNASTLGLAVTVLVAVSASGCILRGPGSAPGAKGGGEVVLCHKGKKTMTLPREAAAAHMDHGDRYGSC